MNSELKQKKNLELRTKTKKMWSVYTLVFYAAVKKSELIKSAGILVDLEIIFSLLRLQSTNTTCSVLYTDYNFEAFMCVYMWVWVVV